MSITIKKSNQLKSLAILMMLCLHLFNRDYKNLFQPLLFVGKQPFSYYISLFSDACVPIFAFVSGYGLYYSYKADKQNYLKKNIVRTKKLYIRFWVILLIFAVGLGYILDKDGYPGSLQKFILNFTAIKTNYNGAWWFLTTYLLFIFTSYFWFTLLDKINPYIYMIILLLVYLTAFYFRVYRANFFENEALNWVYTQTALYFCTLFQFMLGAFSLKYKWHNKIVELFAQLKYKSIISIIGIGLLVVFHGFVPNFIVAPFTALGFIFLFLQIKFGVKIESFLDFFTPHATNLWLIHMFFYMIYFKEMIYAPQNPTLIFILLVLWCLAASYVVNFIYKKIPLSI